MSKVPDLLTKRAAAFAVLNDMRGKADANGNFSADDEAKFRAADSDFERLTKQIEDEKRHEAREKEMAEAEYEQRGGGKNGSEREDADTRPTATKAYRSAYVNYLRGGASSLSAEQRNVLRQGQVSETEMRGTATQITTTNSLGGFAVPIGFEAELNKAMKYYANVMDIVRYMPTVTGNDIQIPTIDDTGTLAAQQTTEGAALTVQDLTLAQVVMKAYTYARIGKFSEQLMQDSGIDIEAEARDLFAESLGRKMAETLTNGTGTGQPQGLVTGSTAGKVAASATVLTVNDLIDTQTSVNAAYKRSPFCAWMMSDEIAGIIRKVAIGTGDARFLWEPALTSGVPDRLLGYTWHINSDMATALAVNAKVALFGDFSKYRLRHVNNFVTKRLDERYADEMAVGILLASRWDGRYVISGAVKHLAMAAA